MTTILLYLAAAVCGYLAAGFNPAIALSRAVYHRDIRTCGSGNPGFTNFKRNFGWRLGWLVLLLDLTKAAAVVGLFGWLFGRAGLGFSLGAAYTGAFAMLGHAYPVFYRFRGGKGFLVCLSTVWVLDARVGLIVTALMVVLLLATGYMSLATVLAMWAAPILLGLFGAPTAAVLLCMASVLFMTWRHRANFVRLLRGREPKFSLRDKKEA